MFLRIRTQIQIDTTTTIRITQYAIFIYALYEFSHPFCFSALKLHGMMRVILEPLIGDVPIVGAVSMFFIKRPVRLFTLTSVCPPIPVTIVTLSLVLKAFPAIDFSSINSRDHFAECGTFLCRISSQKLEINWTGLTNLLDIPGLK